MRTVFQLQGSVDADGLNEELDALEAELRAPARPRRRPTRTMRRSIRALDCRYVGQGYELRVPLEGPFAEASLAEFHRLHEREYGSAYPDPIEIVNAASHGDRQRARRSSRCTVGRRAADEALVGESESHFRVDGVLSRVHDAVLRPRPAAARRIDRRRRRRLPPRHDHGRPARLERAGRCLGQPHA